MFVTQGPVDPQSPLFIGRTTELKKMEEWLTQVNCVGAILGARQTGKTSLLLKLRHTCREKYAAVFVDLQAIEGASASECFRYIAEELSEQLPASNTISGIEFPGDSQAFLSHLKKLAGVVPSVRIIVILDELGALPAETALKLCSTIRAIFTSRLVKPEFARYIFLLAGGTDMLELTKGRNSPLKNVTESIYLGDLSLAETEQLLSAAVGEKGVRPDPLLSRRLHLWTSGHPYWTQLLASNLESQAKTPTESLLRALINQLLETEDKNLPHVFGSLEREGERLGNLIVSLLDGNPVSFSRSHSPVAKLELIGILKNNRGRCAFRNQIYQEAMQRHFC